MKSLTQLEGTLPMNQTAQASEGFRIIGITTRTTNAAEMAGAGKIAALWSEYYFQGKISEIPNPIKPHTVAVYHDYESDASGPFSLLIGLEVSKQTEAPAGFIALDIPPQKYVTITSEQGPMPQVIIEAWQKVWSLTEQKKIDRIYSFDLEIYDERAQNPMNGQVDIRLAVKESL